MTIRTQAGKALLARVTRMDMTKPPITPDGIQTGIAAIEAEAREPLRFGWCCDFDFDNGTYRTADCISRTRDADAVERPYARLAENGYDIDEARYQRDAIYHAIVHRIHKGPPPEDRYFTAAIRVGAQRERKRLRALFTSMALSLGWSKDLHAAILSWLSDPDPIEYARTTSTDMLPPQAKP